MPRKIVWTIDIESTDLSSQLAKVKREALEVRSAISEIEKQFRTLASGGRQAQELRSELEKQGRSVKDLENEYGLLIKRSEQLKLEQRDLTTEVRKVNQAFRDIDIPTNSYIGLSNRLKEVRQELQRIDPAIDRVRFNKLAGEARQLERRLDSLNVAGTRFRRTLGRMSQGLDLLTGGLVGGGLAVGLLAVGRVMGETIRIFRDFQQEMALVGAITGATPDEFKRLEAEARRLGETTQFTATQVAEIQKAFARVGFDVEQIIDATEAVTNLSIATQEAAERAAIVVAASIKAFNLEAEEATRVTDVMTASFNNSALNLEKFENAIKFVGPVAASAGIDIEGTAAAMASLADAGLEGSQVGTVLRRILVDLSNENSKLAKEVGFATKNTEDMNNAFAILAERGIDNARAFELVGRVAQSGLLVLTQAGQRISETGDDAEEAVSKLDRLAEGFARAQGEAARTAAVVGDTLTQDILKAESALEGLAINLVSVANDGLRNAVQGFTSLIGVINEYISIPVSDQLRQEQSELNTLVNVLSNTNLEERQRLIILDEIRARYPDFLGNLSDEEALYSDLSQRLAEVNREFARKIAIQVQEERLSELFKEQNDNLRDQIELEKQLDQTRRGNAARESAGISGGGLGGGALNREDVLLSAIETNADRREELNKQIEEEFKTQDELLFRLGITQNEYNQTLDENTQKTNQNVSAQQRQTSALELLRNEQSRLKNEIEELAIAGQDFSQELEAYNEISKEINQVTDIFNQTAAKQAAEIENLADGSIAKFRKQISELRKEIEQSGDENEIAAKLQEIADLETDLNRAEDKIKEIADLINGDSVSFDFSTEEIEKFASELEQVNQLQRDSQNFVANNDGIDSVSLEADLQRELLEIETRKQLAISKTVEERQKAGDRAEEIAERINEIEEQAEIRRLQTIRDSGTVEISEKLRIANEIAQLELEAEDRKNQQLKQKREELFRQFGQIADTVLGGINTTLSGIEGLQEQRTDARVQQIERSYEAELALAEGNADEINRIEQERDAQIEELQRAQFERSKKLQIAQALIGAAQAVISTLTAPAGAADILSLGAFRAIQIGIVAATTAAQIATISAQTFADGGVIDGSSHKEGGIKMYDGKTGKYKGEIEGQEIVMKKTVTKNKKAKGVASFINQLFGGKAFGGEQIPKQLREDLAKHLTGSEIASRTVRGLAQVIPISKFMDGGIIGNNVPQVTRQSSVQRISLSDDAVNKLNDNTTQAISNVADEFKSTMNDLKEGLEETLTEQNRLAARLQRLEKNSAA